MAIGFDPLILSNYYAAKLPLSQTQIAAVGSQTKAAPMTPWDIRNKKPPQQTQDVAVRNSDPYFDPSAGKDLLALRAFNEIAGDCGWWRP